ncbi:MAG: MFS transporter [Candidatus Acidiferrum sp.]
MPRPDGTRARGYTPTFSGLVTVATQTPAGGVVDAAKLKSACGGGGVSVLVAGAILLMASPTALSVYAAQLLIGGAGAFLMPAVAAITLGIVGAKRFDCQFGKNQSFNSAGNGLTALLVAYGSYKLGYRAIFAVAAVLAIPCGVVGSVHQRDGDRSRASSRRKGRGEGSKS